MKPQFPTEQSDSGEFQRQEDAFREWISNDGSTSYPAAADRYHLYVSLACPWASRTVIFRKLKGLEDAIGITVDLMERTFSKIDIENGEVTLQVTPFEIVRLEFYLG